MLYDIICSRIFYNLFVSYDHVTVTYVISFIMLYDLWLLYIILHYTYLPKFKIKKIKIKLKIK